MPEVPEGKQARIFVVASSQFTANPFARAGNGPDMSQFGGMMPQGGDEKLLQIAGPYADLSRGAVPILYAILTMKNTLDWLSGDVDLLAVSAKILSEPGLEYGDVKAPKFDENATDEDLKRQEKDMKEARKTTQQKIEFVEDEQVKLRCASCGSTAEAGPVEVRESIFDRPKVLCIDDDHLLLGLVRDTLEANGFEAITATDGPTGVEIARKVRPDVILVDVLMPRVSGFEVCKRLRAAPALKETPIILMTAMSDPGLKEKGLEAGASLAMPKPFDPMQIVSVINKALALKSKRHTL